MERHACCVKIVLLNCLYQTIIMDSAKTLKAGFTDVYKLPHALTETLLIHNYQENGRAIAIGVISLEHQNFKFSSRYSLIPMIPGFPAFATQSSSYRTPRRHDSTHTQPVHRFQLSLHCRKLVLLIG